MGQPVFYLLAGPNGAGKSTLYRALVLAGTIPAAAEFVNADLHEAAQLQHVANLEQRSEHARQWADARRAKLLQASQSFVSETVFSHASKLTLIQDAQARGFFVMLLVVALDQPERLLAHLTQAVRLADAAILYDTADVSPGTHTAVATCKGDWTQELVQPMPEWARRVLWD